MNPKSNRDPSEALTPRAARRQFLDAKHKDVKKSTYRAYKYPTRHFIEYCEDQEIQSIGNVTSYLMETWVQTRQGDDVKPITAHQNVKLVRVFIKWCENSGLIEPGTYDRVRVPAVSKKERVSKETVKAHVAEEVINYLSTYHYATRQHAFFRLMWGNAARASGLIALDLDDIGRDEHGRPSLHIADRPKTGTALKNGDEGDRTIMLDETVRDLLNDYIQTHRHDVTDEYGREPLFTTEHGRLTRQRAYKNAVAYTRPCVYSDGCPIDKDPETCEFAKKKRAMSCPESTSLHPIRRGSITHHINKGWPKEKLSERVDVSIDVLNKHYDAREEKDALERRNEYRDLL